MRLEERMKLYEGMEAGRSLMPRLPALARLDGRCFRTFTKGMSKPYDERMIAAMQLLTKTLVGETNAKVGYTQSDEITLAWYLPDPKSQVYFAGRIQKMVSSLAATASIRFLEIVSSGILSDFADRRPTFDCRVWNVPTLEEAANVFVWRETDATRNSIQAAAQSVYSHKQLHNKNSSELRAMLYEKGINWDDYPARFKRGSYYAVREVERAFTAEEIEKLPAKHAARTNPELTVQRHEVQPLHLPPLLRITNRADVLLRGEEPRERS